MSPSVLFVIVLTILKEVFAIAKIEKGEKMVSDYLTVALSYLFVRNIDVTGGDLLCNLFACQTGGDAFGVF